MMSTGLTRRQITRLALGAAALPLFSASASAAPRRLAYNVRRNGGAFGTHQITLTPDGRRLTVDIAIKLQVKAAFITLYKYDHRNTEIWEDGKLLSITTKTNDNGKEYALKGTAARDRFEIDGAAGQLTAPDTIIPTSYWNPALVNQTELLDTQKGRLFSVAIEPAGETTRPVGADERNCTKFRMSGDLDLDLYYASSRVWAGCAFNIKGSSVDYAATELPNRLPVDWLG